MPWALGPAIELAGVWTALGLLALTAILVAALFQVADRAVGWVPWLGDKAQASLRVHEQRVNSRLSAWVNDMQGVAAASWNTTAAIFEETGKAIWDVAMLGHEARDWAVNRLPARIDAVASAIPAKVSAGTKAATRPFVNNYYVTKGATKADLNRLGKKLAGLAAGLAVLQHAIAHAPPHTTVHWPDLAKPLKGIRARLGKLEWFTTRKGRAALVAAGLATLGLQWIRKDCARRNNDLLCRTNFDALEGLLGGLILILGTVSLLDLARGMQGITEEVTDAVRAFIRETRPGATVPAAPAFGLEGAGGGTAVATGLDATPARPLFGLEG